MFWGKICHFELTFSAITIYCFSHLFILKFGMGKFFGVRNPKITLTRLKVAHMVDLKYVLQTNFFMI